MTRPLRVFLCHASQDKPAVRGLYKRLAKEKWLDPWLDEEKLSFGQHWTTVIEDALDAADVVLIFLSRSSVNKEGFVQRELNYAWEFSLEKPHGVIYLIPFRLDNCEVPRFLRSRQWGDYFGNKEETTYQILLRSLEQRYEQKINLETEEIALDKSTREKEKRERVERESAEKTTLEKAKLFQAERMRKSKERRINKDANRYDKQESAQKFVDAVFNWFSVNFRRLGVVLAFLVFGGFGLNYLLNNLPVAPSAIPSPTPKNTSTVDVSTSTSAPFTPTPRLTETPIPTPTLGIGSTMIGEKGETLVYVPAGEFTMGSDTYPDEQPIHTVYLDVFWIDQTEVTNKQYKACVDVGTCEPPSSEESNSHANYYGNPEFDDYPVIYVNWDKANRYCEVWTGGDLPTEAQWEKAARGTDARTYPWGNEAPSANLLNFNSNVGDTTVVKNYRNTGSFYGAYDMAGNVWEWVNDFYGGAYYQSSNLSKNPLGPESGNYRVLRGGSWDLFDEIARSAYRNRYDPSVNNFNIGFRCSRSP